MNPTPDAGSPLATLRQLKEMLDAGAITQQEFDALKQRLIFGADPGAPAPSAAAPPADATVALAAAPPTPYLDTPTALTPEATPLLAPEPDWLPAPAPAPLTPVSDDEPTEAAEATEAERRNPLNLIFALGGLLLFLAVVAYLTLGHRPDEHVTSQSQTAADSTAVRPDEGPQAEQLVLPPASAPDTVRVVPATPPPAATALDSAAVQAVRPPAPATAPRPTTTVPEGRMEAAADSTSQR